ncbi:MAG: penicillin-binding protein 1A [Bacteroidota bacterium]
MMTAQNKALKKLIRTMWIVFLLFLGTIPLYIFTVKINLWNLYGALPSLAVLENPENDLSSELYASDGVLLGKYFRNNRSPVAYEEISQNVINALLATEDCRFANHAGIDLKGLHRVFLFSILLQRNKGGGSTLTQQLAKNLFKTRSERYKGLLSKLPFIKTAIVKTKEWVVAAQLERSYTKQEIITMYLNTVDFGSNALGIKVATKTFFNTTPDSLSVEQAALLVGLLKAPSYYSPMRYPERARRRRNVVLGQLCKHQLLTQEDYEQLKAQPITLEYKVEDHNMGLATYFRSAIRDFLLQWAHRHGYDLFADGLKIYTTIDSRLQKHAEEAVVTHMQALQQSFDQHWAGANPWIDQEGNEIDDFIEKAAKRTTYYKCLVEEYGDDKDKINTLMNTPVATQLFSWEGEIDAVISPIDALRYNKRLLHAGFMAMEPHTGHIKAWVGGINYKHFQYDHVMQGKRQPGSTFKPIVYAAAIDNGYMPWHKVVDAPVTFRVPGDPPIWMPRNWNKVYTGQAMTLRQAMARSVNSITAYLMKQLGPALVVDYAKRLGINSPLAPVPSLCLGSGDVSVYELVGAYSTFMNKGVWTAPLFITHIEDKNGRVLEVFTPQKREAISEKTAYLMVHMLKGTIEEPGGTSRGITPAIKDENEIGGKTGTTSNQSDGWFVGMSRGLCTGVWVGGEDRCVHFRTLGLGSGARTARPIWEKFMLSIYADPELPYEKGPLTDYAPPTDLNIPIQHKAPQETPPAQEEAHTERISVEHDMVDTEVDVSEIF